MLASCIWEVPRTERIAFHRWIVCLPCLLALLLCNDVMGQVQAPQDEPQGRSHSEFASQLVTPNALRAPGKAQHAVDKALKAVLHHDSQDAAKELERALAIYPDYATALTLRAILNMTRDPVTATTDLEHAIRADPTYGVAYAVLASIYNDSQQPANALVNANKALQFLPEAWPVHYETARALFCLHRNERALQEINEAIRGISRDANAGAGSRATVHYLRGIILINQHELSEARRELKEAIKEEPTGSLSQPSNQLLARLSSTENR